MQILPNATLASGSVSRPVEVSYLDLGLGLWIKGLGLISDRLMNSSVSESRGSVFYRSRTVIRLRAHPCSLLWSKQDKSYTPIRPLPTAIFGRCAQKLTGNQLSLPYVAKKNENEVTEKQPSSRRTGSNKNLWKAVRRIPGVHGGKDLCNRFWALSEEVKEW